MNIKNNEIKYKVIFSEKYRYIPYRRSILNIIRSIHILCIALLTGGYYFQIEKSLLLPWLIITILSGLSMFLIDLYVSSLALFEFRGITIIIKLTLLSLLPLLESYQQIYLLIFIMIFSVFISHSSKKIRHKRFLPGFVKAQLELENQPSNLDTKK